MKTFAISVWAMYLLAANAALVASVFNVETILVTGPILTVAGLVLAYATRPLRSSSVVAFSLSGPLVGALIALSIATFQWGPAEAQKPVSLILACYLFVFWPASGWTLYQLAKWETRESNRLRFMQFSLKTLLFAMTAMCLLIVIAKYFYEFLFPAEAILFAAFGLGVAVACAIISWRHHAVRAAARAHSTPASERPPVVDLVDVEHLP